MLMFDSGGTAGMMRDDRSRYMLQFVYFSPHTLPDHVAYIRGATRPGGRKLLDVMNREPPYFLGLRDCMITRIG